jgi:hypothetical protein
MSNEPENNNNYMMRTPRARPDLRLAESYIPGVVAWVKGIAYTSLCLLVQYGNIEVGFDGAGKLLMLRALPLVILYYDHIIYSYIMTANTYVDSTAVATDVIAGTIAAQFAHLDYSCTSAWCWLIPLIWAALGACHVYNGDWYIPRGGNHIITACCVLFMFLFSKGIPHHPTSHHHTNMTTDPLISGGTAGQTTSIMPYYARAASYLSLVVIDAYMIRPPLQREKDRVGLIRYGALLFAPIIPLVACMLILAGVQVAKIYVEMSAAPASSDHHGAPPPHQPLLNSYTGSQSQQKAAEKSLVQGGGFQHHFPVAAQRVATPNSVDALDVQEAFRLAKLHYMDGKASV